MHNSVAAWPPLEPPAKLMASISPLHREAKTGIQLPLVPVEKMPPPLRVALDAACCQTGLRTADARSGRQGGCRAVRRAGPGLRCLRMGRWHAPLPLARAARAARAARQPLAVARAGGARCWWQRQPRRGARRSCRTGAVERCAGAQYACGVRRDRGPPVPPVSCCQGRPASERGAIG
jgi:hypothetical protein